MNRPPEPNLVDNRYSLRKLIDKAAHLAVVRDSGMGIEPRNQPHIFEPLFSTKSFGVGLGMTIVMDVMQAHGGGIEVESQPQQGTTITLWLPRD